MKYIENYMKKIEDIIALRNKSTTKTKDAKGLLSPSKSLQSKEQPKTDIDVIASFVQSIRQARKEMKNG